MQAEQGTRTPYAKGCFRDLRASLTFLRRVGEIHSLGCGVPADFWAATIRACLCDPARRSKRSILNQGLGIRV